MLDDTSQQIIFAVKMPAERAACDSGFSSDIFQRRR